MEIDPAAMGAVRDRLGPLYDAYVQVLLDVGTPPIFAIHDVRGRVVEARTRAADELHAWQHEAPAVVAALAESLPLALHDVNEEADGAVEAGIHRTAQRSGASKATVSPVASSTIGWYTERTAPSPRIWSSLSKHVVIVAIT